MVRCARITAARLSDSDKYICVARNSLSRILVGAELTVQGKNEAQRILRQPYDYLRTVTKLTTILRQS